jgi:hypothetical protein
MTTRPPNLISCGSRVNYLLEGELCRQFGNFSLPLGLSSYSEVVFCVHFRYYLSTGLFHMGYFIWGISIWGIPYGAKYVCV